MTSSSTVAESGRRRKGVAKPPKAPRLASAAWSWRRARARASAVTPAIQPNATGRGSSEYRYDAAHPLA